jgi:hypothetical protein
MEKANEAVDFSTGEGKGHGFVRFPATIKPSYDRGIAELAGIGRRVGVR